jgi:hypothetical protein
MTATHGPRLSGLENIVFLIDASNHKSGISSSNWVDIISKNGATGFVNASFVNDGPKSYYDLQSSNSKITFFDSETTRNIFDGGGSLESWVYAESSGGGGAGRWINKRNTIEQDGWIALVRAGSTGSVLDVEFFVFFSGNNAQWRVEDGISTNSWNHIVITYNSDSTSNTPLIYINGVNRPYTVVASPTGTRSDDTNADIIVGNADNNIRAWDGRVGSATFYNRILTLDEIVSNFNSTKDRFGL